MMASTTRPLPAEQAGATDDRRADRVQQHVAATLVRVDDRPWRAATMPAIAASVEQIMKHEIRIRATPIPARRAASALPPTA